jgi:hypothetical protein
MVSRRLDGSPGEVVIGEQRFVCSAFRPRHLAQIKRYMMSVRRTPMAVLLDEINRVPEAQQKELLARAYEETTKSKEPTDGEAFEYSESLDGMATLVWVCARDHNQALKREAVVDAIDAVDEKSDDLKNFIDSVSREIFRSDPTKPEPSAAPARKSRQKGRR